MLGLPVESSTTGQALRHVTPLPPVGFHVKTERPGRADVTIRTTERLPHGEPLDVEYVEGGVTFTAKSLTVVGSISTWPHHERTYRLRGERPGASFELAVKHDPPRRMRFG